jgi:hypothetical protein
MPTIQELRERYAAELRGADLDGLTPEQIMLAVQHGRDQQFAALVTMAVGLAARTHPEMIRDALAEVFDLGAYEETAKRVERRMHSADWQGRAKKLEDRVAALEQQLLAAGDSRLTALTAAEQRIAALEQTVQKIRAWAARVTKPAAAVKK